MEKTAFTASVRAAREVARTASQLAYEAATLAQMFEDPGARHASLAAAQASIQAAKRAFELQDDAEREPSADALSEALRRSRDALDDAMEAVRAARDSVDAAVAFHARASRSGGAAGEG